MHIQHRARSMCCEETTNIFSCSRELDNNNVKGVKQSQAGIFCCRCWLLRIMWRYVECEMFVYTRVSRNFHSQKCAAAILKLNIHRVIRWRRRWRTMAMAKRRSKINRRGEERTIIRGQRTTTFYQILNSNSNIEYYPLIHRISQSCGLQKYMCFFSSPLTAVCRYLFAYLHLISFIWPSSVLLEWGKNFLTTQSLLMLVDFVAVSRHHFGQWYGDRRH